VGYNFEGNHTICDDPGIDLPLVWAQKDNKYFKTQAEETSRGSQKSRWCVEKILDSGYALVTAYYCDLVPDFPGGRAEGIQGVFDSQNGAESQNASEKSEEWGAIAAWAWGLSMICNLASMEEQTSDINWNKIAVIGHSRLGKTALWAGATDERFAVVISNNSGCGGAALSRREFGETLFRMNSVFPHWLDEKCKTFNLNVNELPVDQHELIALIAPRHVYVASAEEDVWADPRGEFLSCLFADPVYKLLGTEGIGESKEMPTVNSPIGETIGYHIRTGKHDINEYDWDQYIKFVDKHFGKQ
ncbi:MAG: acetylxylan esterase, partial [Thermoguttaceae bacterium]